jgi:hypothetical protein
MRRRDRRVGPPRNLGRHDHARQGPVQSNGMCLLELIVHWKL